MNAATNLSERVSERVAYEAEKLASIRRQLQLEVTKLGFSDNQVPVPEIGKSSTRTWHGMGRFRCLLITIRERERSMEEMQANADR